MIKWRKASRSDNTGANCVELGWRKASSSGNSGANCVELSAHLVRDSKNASGPRLRGDVRALITWVKSGMIVVRG
jgi:hypothetical protein